MWPSTPYRKMENENIFMESNDIPNGNSVVPGSLIDSNSFGFYNQNYGLPMLSALQGDARIFNSNDLITFPEHRLARDDHSVGGSRLNNNIGFQEHVMGGTPISSASLATLLAARCDILETPNNIGGSVPLISPSEGYRSYNSDYCPAEINQYNNQTICSFSNKWNFENFHAQHPLNPYDISLSRTEFQPSPYEGNPGLHDLISSNSENMSLDFNYGLSTHNNELSLSLASSKPAAISCGSVSDRCSGISSSSCSLEATKLGSEQNSCNSKEVSMSFRSNAPPQFSQLILGSRYLDAIQGILAQIASYSLENSGSMSYSSICKFAGGYVPFQPVEYPGNDNNLGNRLEPAYSRQAVEAVKSQLLNLLQVVDDQYNHCVDEVHTVISAFHAATDLDPLLHARFALQTISFLYRNLRERISSQILAFSSQIDIGRVRGKEKCHDNSFLPEQWAIQHLKRKQQHHSWRPQRGLPEKSVSVLRAWMFQNFLHPYPKDAEKHLLAIKSGLTRGQVSNWFINARVRLWKPMIDEMYAEMNRRKSQGNEEGNGSNNMHIRQICYNNQRFSIN